MKNRVKGPEFDILHICRVMVFNATFTQHYFGYMSAVSFIGAGNGSQSFY